MFCWWLRCQYLCFNRQLSRYGKVLQKRSQEERQDCWRSKFLHVFSPTSRWIFCIAWVWWHRSCRAVFRTISLETSVPSQPQPCLLSIPCLRWAVLQHHHWSHPSWPAGTGYFINVVAVTWVGSDLSEIAECCNGVIFKILALSNKLITSLWSVLWL